MVGNPSSERVEAEFSALQQVFYPRIPVSGNPSPEAAAGLWKSVAQGAEMSQPRLQLNILSLLFSVQRNLSLGFG